MDRFTKYFVGACLGLCVLGIAGAIYVRTITSDLRAGMTLDALNIQDIISDIDSRKNSLRGMGDGQNIPAEPIASPYKTLDTIIYTDATGLGKTSRKTHE